MSISSRLALLSGLLGLVAFAACSSSTTVPAAVADAGDVADSAPEPEPERADAADAADAAPPRCTGDAGDPCVACDLQNCCDERQACLTDTTCKAAYDMQIACIASTPAGTAERHACFMTFETKGTKAQTYHFCEERSCRGATACNIP